MRTTAPRIHMRTPKPAKSYRRTDGENTRMLADQRFGGSGFEAAHLAHFRIMEGVEVRDLVHLAPYRRSIPSLPDL
jgi:hypothetical protein